MYSLSSLSNTIPLEKTTIQQQERWHFFSCSCLHTTTRRGNQLTGLWLWVVQTPAPLLIVPEESHKEGKKEERKKESLSVCKNSRQMQESRYHLAVRRAVFKTRVAVLLGWCQCTSISLSAQTAAAPLKWVTLQDWGSNQLSLSFCLSLSTKNSHSQMFFSMLRANYIKSLCSDPPSLSLNQLFNRQSHTRTARAWGVLEWAYSTPRTPIISRAPCSQNCGFSAQQI